MSNLKASVQGFKLPDHHCSGARTPQDVERKPLDWFILQGRPWGCTEKMRKARRGWRSVLGKRVGYIFHLHDQSPGAVWPRSRPRIPATISVMLLAIAEAAVVIPCTPADVIVLFHPLIVSGLPVGVA